MRPSAKSRASTKQNLIAQFVVDGQIDMDAVREYCQKEADRLWTGHSLIHGTKEGMVENFVKDIVQIING